MYFDNIRSFNQSLVLTRLAGARLAAQLTSEGVCREKSFIMRRGRLGG